MVKYKGKNVRGATSSIFTIEDGPTQLDASCIALSRRVPSPLIAMDTITSIFNIEGIDVEEGSIYNIDGTKYIVGYKDFSVVLINLKTKEIFKNESLPTERILVRGTSTSTLKLLEELGARAVRAFVHEGDIIEFCNIVRVTDKTEQLVVDIYNKPVPLKDVFPYVGEFKGKPIGLGEYTPYGLVELVGYDVCFKTAHGIEKIGGRANEL